MAILGEAFVDVRPDTASLGPELTSKLTSIFTALTSPVGLLATATVGAAAGLFAIGSSFEESFNKIRAGTGATEEEMGGLEDSFKRVLAAGPESMSQVATALTLVSERTHLTGGDLEGLTEQMEKLSRITGLEVQPLVDATTKTFANWGIEGLGPSKKALEELLDVSQKTGIDIPTLASSIQGKAGASFRALGVDIGAAASIMGELQAAGVQTGPVIMSLQKALVEAQKSGVDANTFLGQLFDTLKDGKDGSIQMAQAIGVLGSRGFETLRDAVRTGKLSFEDFSGTLGDTAGNIDRIAEKNLTLGDKFDILKNKALVALEPIAMKVVELANAGFDKMVAGLGYIGDGFSSLWDAAHPIVDELTGGVRAMVAAFMSPGEGITSSGFAGALERIGIAAREGIGAAREEIARLVDFYGPRLADLWHSLVNVWDGSVYPALHDKLLPVLQAIGSWIGDHLNIVLGGLGLALALAISPVGTLVGGFILLYAHSEPFRNVVDNIARALTSFATVAAQVAVTVGSALLPVVRAVGASFADLARFFEERWSRISAAVEHVFAVLRVLFVGFAAVTIGPFILLWQHFGDQISAVIGFAFAEVQNVLSTFVRILGDVFDFITSLLAGDWGGAWDAFKDIPAAAIDYVLGSLGNIYNFMVDFFSSLPANLLSFVTGLGSLLADAGSSALGGMVSGVTSGAVALLGWFASLPLTILNAVGDAQEWLIDSGAHAIGGLLSGISNHWRDVASWLAGLAGRMARGAGNAALWLFDKGKDALTGMLHGLYAADVALGAYLRELPGRIVGWLGDAATWLIDEGPSALWGFIQGFGRAEIGVATWFIQLPGRMLGWLGDALSWLVPKGIDAVWGLVNGLVQTEFAVLGWLFGLPGKMLGWAGDALTWLKDKGVDAVTGIVNGMESGIGSIIDWVRGLPNRIILGIGDFASLLADLGWDIVDGLKTGFDRAWHDILDWVKSKAGDLVHIFTHPWEAFSPSRVTMRLGKNIMEGLAVGLADNAHLPETALSRFSLRIPGLEQKLANASATAFGSGATTPAHPSTVGGSLDLRRTNELLEEICRYLGRQPTRPVHIDARGASANEVASMVMAKQGWAGTTGRSES